MPTLFVKSVVFSSNPVYRAWRGADTESMIFGFLLTRQNQKQWEAKHSAARDGHAQRAAELEKAAARFTQSGNAKMAASFAEQAAELRRAGY